MSEKNPSPEPLEEPKKPFPWFYSLLALIMVLILGGLAAPMVIPGRGRKIDEQSEQTSNARQIGLALFEFETEYGTFPSEETAIDVATNNPENKLDLSGKSSNALFRQLIAANITQSEQMFYAKVKGARKPDGDISPGKALEAGEVGFGLIAGTSTAGNPTRPIAFAPIIPGTDRFDPKPFDGKAVMLRIDNSVSSIMIDKNGHAIFEGQNILSPDHPVWKGIAPDIRYPE